MMGVGTLTKLTATQILDGLHAAILAEMQAATDYHSHSQAATNAEMSEALATLGDVEREHALRLAKRIAALGGSPPSDQPAPQPTGATLAEWLAHDLGREQWAIVEYARMVAGIVDDEETAELMAELLRDEIRHARWLKSALRRLGDG
ncbi:MAG: ferritin-like domain-containing protein [Anaerolineae bacterium]|jgi:bacterioferritin (cytochrome b1)